MARYILKISLGLLIGIAIWLLTGLNTTFFIIITILLVLLFLWPKIFFRFVVGVIAFVILVWLLIQTSPVQNFISGKVAAKLSADLHTTVKIGHVDFSLFDKMDLNNTLILDQHKDTLLKAGALKLRITDWFFFKSNIELKYIGLEDALIKQQRTDSVWNYQFLIDHFSTPGKAKKQSKKIVLKVQKVDLKNVIYIKNDYWVGQKAIIKAGSVLIDADDIDISENRILINSIDADKAYYKVENFDGKKPPVTKPVVTVNASQPYFNPSNLYIRIGTIKIKDGFFGTGVLNEKPVAGVFDGQKIEVSKINGTINNFRFIKDTIAATVNLNAVERSGFKLRKLQADYKLTPQKMEFSRLFIKTNNSTLANYFVMEYHNFKSGMSHYVDSVVMRANLKNSYVTSGDIAFFAPAVAKWGQQFSLGGFFNGTVSDFNVRNVFLRNGNNTYVSGDLHIKDVTNAKKFVVDLQNANVQTNTKELGFVLPALNNIKSPDLAALGNVHFTGNVNASVAEVKAKGVLASALGGVYTDIALAFPAKGEPSYKGSIQTRQFNLGKFLSVDKLGNVNFDGKVQGRSFNLDKIATKINGRFSTLTFNGYPYSNLVFNGEIKHKNFVGDFSANDTNFNFTSSIVINLADSVPAFNVFGDLVNANLHALHLAKDSIVVTGTFDMDFHGRNIDDFLGYAKMLNASVTHNNQTLVFDSLSLSAALDSNNQKKLTLQSSEFAITVEGRYKILQLPQSFQSFLNHYYPSVINPPKNVLRNQNFTVTIRTADFENFAKLIDSNLAGFNNLLLAGKVNTEGGNTFKLEIHVPHAAYKKLSLFDASISGDGDDDSLLLMGDIGRFYVSDSTYFPNTGISIRSASDVSHVFITTSANTTLNEAKLEADVHTMKDGVRINFNPSSFTLNNKTWNLQNQGEVVVGNHFSSARNMKFTQGFQEISIESVGGADSSNGLAVRLKDVDIGDITPLFLARPKLEGVANGNVYLRDIYTNLNGDGKLKLTQFRLNNDSIGVAEISSRYNKQEGLIGFKVDADNKDFVLNGDGFYSLKDSIKAPLQTTLRLKHAKIGILNTFLGTLFDDIEGFATGTIHLNGSFKNLHLTGNAHLDSGALTVKYTQVRYKIPSADFVFYDDRLDFGTFNITDKFGNTAKAGGILYENAFQNNRYNFNISTGKLLLLDTKAKDNPLFYGTVIGKANLSLTGPQENMRMSISGEPADISSFYIQTNTSKKSADADFIIFKQYGKQAEVDTTATLTNLNIDLDLIANNKITVSVILDELTGDIIQATGNGRLSINVPAVGDISMKGRYNIEQGNYNFNFQSLVKKPFELLPDQNSFIEWNGDPFNANIDITARYVAKDVSVSDLSSSSSVTLDQNVQAYRGDVYVIAELVGKLSQPQIKFRLDFPEGSILRSNDNFNRLLAKMESDENEMLKQVTWLIVFDAFSPYGEFSNNQALVQSAGINTISQKIAGVLNTAVSDLLYKLTGDKSLHFDVGAKTYSSYSLSGGSSGNTLDRTAVELKLNKSLFDNKVIVTFGGDLDFNVSGAAATTNNNLQWLPDISVQIVLTKDRKLRAIVFNHSSLGASNTGTIGRVTRQGVSISYTKDFDRIFGKKEDDIYFQKPVPPDSSNNRQSN